MNILIFSIIWGPALSIIWGLWFTSKPNSSKDKIKHRIGPKILVFQQNHKFYWVIYWTEETGSKVVLTIGFIDPLVKYDNNPVTAEQLVITSSVTVMYWHIPGSKVYLFNLGVLSTTLRLVKNILWPIPPKLFLTSTV